MRIFMLLETVVADLVLDFSDGKGGWDVTTDGKGGWDAKPEDGKAGW
jgi:hypothetical protein